MNPLKVAVPPGVVTVTLPEAPVPTTAAMFVAEFTVKELGAVPPKLASDAPVKSVPVMVIMVPVPPLTGENEVIVGEGM